MATMNANNPESTASLEKGRHTGAHHGLFTPESTPEPDGASHAPPGPSNLTSQSKPTFDGASNDESDDSDVEPASQKQVDAVKRVLDCDRKDYHAILGIPKEYKSSNEAREAARDGWIKVGTAVHPDYNPAKGAKKASKSMSSSCWFYFHVC